jgi:hypothetical protein
MQTLFEKREQAEEQDLMTALATNDDTEQGKMKPFCRAKSSCETCCPVMYTIYQQGWTLEQTSNSTALARRSKFVIDKECGGLPAKCPNIQ